LKTISVPPDRPLDPITLQVLLSVNRAAQDLAITYFVSGAMARDIVLKHALGFRIERATHDLDLAVHTDSWTQFNALKSTLVSTGRFSAVTGELQRLTYDSIYRVDLVPFGAAMERDGLIAWPPDQALVMNMAGHQESLEQAWTVILSPQLTVRVAGPANIAVLKLFAWLDRRDRTRKDAQDLALIMSNYAAVIGQDSLHSQEFASLAEVGFAHERAGPLILGKHLRKLLRFAALEQLTNALANPRIQDLLATHMATEIPRSRGEPLDVAEQMLADFLSGLAGQGTG